MKQNCFESYHSQSPRDVPSTASSSKKNYSILPDLATGWKPKNLNIPPPIIITFQSPLTNEVLKASQNTHKVVYYGHIYKNSYAFHSKNNHDYSVKYGLNCEQMPFSVQKSLAAMSTLKERPFYGMHPKTNSKIELCFDSNFQSGNLDVVLKHKDNQFDLFLRPDTNTCGHMQWFYFKIVKPSGFKHKSVKMNICNNRKPKTLYCRGMKPYFLSKACKNSKGIQWKQDGYNIKYQKFQPRQEWQISDMEYPEIRDNSFKYTCLSFEYQFQAEEDEVYVAYCPPYTYSDLKNNLASWKKTANMQQNFLFLEEKLCISLSGLQIPILTVTDQTVPQEEKKNVIVMGRIHPGQSNASYVLKGFIDYLVSTAGADLRKRGIFKIVPMINPDGVILGNYRTGLSGKDLNRKFKAKNIDLFPQIIHLRDYLLKYKINSKAKFTNFLDFHGHSIKKNVFFYGPEYDIWSTKYERSKVLPRILANRTQMFRYKSCIFRVAAFKKTTARAFMLGFVPYCYTIQSSNGLYRSFKSGRDQQFGVQKWLQMGRAVGEALNESFIKIYEDIFIVSKKKKKIQLSSSININIPGQAGLDGNQDCVQNKKHQSKYIQEDQTGISIRMKRKSIDQKSSQSLRKNKADSRQNSPKRYLKSIKNLKKQANQIQIDFPQIKEQECQSDRYSQGKSDCESEGNDLSKHKYKLLTGNIMRVIDSFNKIIGRQKQRLSISKKLKPLKKQKKKKMYNKIEVQQMKLVPSLKHRAAKTNLSQKKIQCVDRQQTFLRFNRLLA